MATLGALGPRPTPGSTGCPDRCKETQQSSHRQARIGRGRFDGEDPVAARVGHSSLPFVTESLSLPPSHPSPHGPSPSVTRFLSPSFSFCVFVTGLRAFIAKESVVLALQETRKTSDSREMGNCIISVQCNAGSLILSRLEPPRRGKYVYSGVWLFHIRVEKPFTRISPRLAILNYMKII